MNIGCVYCQKNRAHQHGLCEICWQGIEIFQGKETLFFNEYTDAPAVFDVDVYLSMHYVKMAKVLILGMKYQQWFWAIPVLSGMMSDQLKRQTMAGFEVIAMPMHHFRMWKRGYNLAALLAKEISRSLSLPVNHGCLIRKKNVKSQQDLKKNERFVNIKGAFGVKNKIPKKVLLVDDVMTTGATIKEACSILVKNGVEKIIVSVGAKAN